MKLQITPEEINTIASTIHGGFTPEEVDTVIIVVQRNCKVCGDAHVTTVMGNAEDNDEAVWMLAKAIERVTEERPFDDV